MPLRYPIILILIFMILALSRGFVVQNFGELISFNALHALAEDGGDGGSGGGDAGDGGSGGGDAGDGGSGGGDAGDGASGGGDAGDGGAGDADGGFGGPSAPAPVIGCMDPSANNYNPSATSQTGITCTYTVLGCMDPSATNYNPSANSQTGITCTYPPTPVCILTINPGTIVAGGSAALAWGFSSDVTSLLINNGIGVKTSRSYQYVTPNTSTTYSGVATSPYGSAVCSASVTVTAAPPAPVLGCMDPTATNYNPAATSQTGITCTYPPAPIIGCMDPSATNYNPAATSQTGVTCTYPPPAAPLCTLTASPASVQTGSPSTLSWTTTNATSFSINQSIGAVTPVASGSRAVTPPSTRTYTGTATGAGGTVTCSATVTVTVTPPPPPAPLCTLTASPASVQTGSPSTLSWTTTNATSFSINQSIGAVTPVASGSRSVSPPTTTTYTGTATGSGGTVTCAATVTIGSEPSGGGAYGGSGGGAYAPNVTLAALPRASTQPLAYLYLSQIPYTGLELGPLGTMVYWVALIAWALALSYLVLFGAVPVANRSLRQFGSRVVSVLNARELAPAPVREPHIIVSEVGHEEEIPEAPQGHSSYDGFKSFAHNGALSIDDIVKSLSRKHPTLDTARNVEPIEKTEPVYENVEPVVDRPEPMPTSVEHVPASTRGLVSALVEGDRAAVFAGLRQQVRGGGAPEKLITDIVCLLDDAYRARIDGTASDAAVTRLSARLSTPTLEKLIAALTTAIDSSYSEGTTGAKLALTRALAVLGA